MVENLGEIKQKTTNDGELTNDVRGFCEGKTVSWLMRRVGKSERGQNDANRLNAVMQAAPGVSAMRRDERSRRLLHGVRVQSDPGTTATGWWKIY